MKLLLTSGGVTNASIRDALTDLLGKPIEDATALCIPTAQWGHPMCGPTSARGFVTGLPPWGGLASLGWRSLGLLELTALPTIGSARWVPWVREADALLVDGGDATYLGHWMRESGLADLLPSLPDTTWVGVSAGSMVMTPRIGDFFVEWQSAPDDRTLGVVDFAIFPHLDVFPTNTIAAAERWATGIGCPAYAIDDQTAIRVVDGKVDVVSEGVWKLLGSTAEATELTELPVAMTGRASPAKAALGDKPVFAYIGSLPQPQRSIAERVDALAAETLPALQRSVKWGMAWYGVGDGWCFSCGGFAGHVKLTFGRGTSLTPVPPATPIGMGKDSRGVELASLDDLDERQVASWMEQAAAMPGFGKR